MQFVTGFRCFAAVVAAVLPTLGHCQIYAGTSAESGAVVLSSFATSEASLLLVPAPPAPAPVQAAAASVQGSAPRISADLHRIIDSAASRSAVSPQLIRAVIGAESNYEPRAVSSRGAIGLMQLLPDTARRFGAQDPFDPAQNVSAGAAYLKWLMAFFGDDLELVLAGYNAGEQAVVRAGRKIPPFAETRAYVKKVMANLQRATPGIL